MARRLITDTELIAIRDVVQRANPDIIVASHHIQQAIRASLGIDIDDSTIRGRFIAMGKPLSGKRDPTNTQQEIPKDDPLEVKVEKPTEKKTLTIPTFDVPEDLKEYIPNASEFECYVERPVDTLLAYHYDLCKYPITQGKQGTGKTYSHAHYAFKRQLPFFLYSAYEDFNLRKYFGDKTIKNGTIEFQEGLFIRAITNPTVILIDEVNAVGEANIKDFNAFLQNRQLFIKDADGGRGKVFKLHPHCKIGFAQNPRSSKYIGGKVRSSDFLGRCTYITYPEFTKKQILGAVTKRFPTLVDKDKDLFVQFYFEIIKAIDSSNIPFDISIRQLNNVIELWIHGVPLKDSILSGMLDIADASSQPKTKEALYLIARNIWKEL